MLRLKHIAMLVVILPMFSKTVLAQVPSWTIDLMGKEKKPAQYEEKLLPSEKTGEKKFGAVRRALQNTTSHYNFYFNANNRILGVIERARLRNKDDYSRLLSYYPYSLTNTAAQKTDLDSVIYKATAGILLHDLRTEWVDNFYLLIGKAYFLKKDFDSAALTFQFINYNLYPRKKDDDGYNKIVGSNNGEVGAGSVSIADKENRNLLQRSFSLPPSRNEALIWQIRTFTEQGEFGDAAGLISILQNDKNLPSRLRNDLEEVTGYWYYAQNNFDSSAVHLANAISNAESKEDKSRWEYLVAQMYEAGGKYEQASDYYVRAAKHTPDPVMDIYARLNEAKMMRNAGNFKELDNSIENLLGMAKRDRYEAFRDVIYYSAAQLTLQRPDTTLGIGYYARSISYNNPTSGYRDKSFFQLGNIAFTQRRYRDAAGYYDSLQLSGKESLEDSALVTDRKDILSRLVPLLVAIEKEDSIQRIAAMPAAEREAFIKKMVRRLRREGGLKEEEDFTAGSSITFASNKKQEVDLFRSAGSNTDWYFDNATLKSRGFNEFKSKWGKRTNVDNWRRRTSSEAAVGKNLNANIDIDATVPQDGKGLPISQLDKLQPSAPSAAPDYSFEGLMAGLPLTTELIDSSNAGIAKYLFAAAQIFQNELEDYSEAINNYESFIKRFPQHSLLPEVYYNLSYCYTKIGDNAKANFYKNLVQTNFAGSNAAKLIANPNALKPVGNSPEVTARYAGIYNLFIEGNFVQAIDAKKKADSLYGKNYWSPQLLYIESVFYIKERDDSNAVAVLKNIQTLYPESPLKEKATTMINVLARRAEIEKYLTDLQVTRMEDDKVIIPEDRAPVAVKAQTAKPAEIKGPPPVIIKKVSADTIKMPEIFTNKSFVLRPEQPHYVVMILDKVDGVYVNEARNAFNRFNKESSATASVVINKDALDANRSLLVFTPFANAEESVKYFDRIKRAAPSEVSWLQASKYSFIIISENNLQLLKTNKDLVSYKQLINANFGNRF